MIEKFYVQETSITGHSLLVCGKIPHGISLQMRTEDAEFIANACNSHDALEQKVSALEREKAELVGVLQEVKDAIRKGYFHWQGTMESGYSLNQRIKEALSKLEGKEK